MKRICLILIVILVLLSLIVSWGGTELNEIKLFVGEAALDCDVSPVIFGDQVFVPIRAVLEQLDFSVEWNNTERLVIATKEEIEIKIKIGHASAILNNNEIILSLPPKLISNRTLVSTEMIEKYIGEDVKWDKVEGVLYVSNKTRINSNNKEITIIFPDFQSGTDFPATQNYYYEFLKGFTEKFEQKKGIRVNIKRLSGEYYYDYIEKRNSELDLQEGPELVFVDVWDSCADLINNGKAAKIKGKIGNLEKLYSGLKDEYFVPVSIYNGNLTLNKEKINSFGMEEPSFDWTSEDYLKIRDTWLENEEIRFNQDEYWNLIKTTWDDIDIFDEETGEVDLNNESINDYVKRIREDIYSKYILYDNYTSENYNNMFNNYRSREFREGIQIFKEELNKHFVMTPYQYRKNLFNPLDSNSIFLDENISVLPDVVEYGKVYSWGFLVNNNGKNIELGFEFLNELLSNEAQVKIYNLGAESSGMAPVNKDIEKEIEKINRENNISEKAVNTRKFILNEVERGDYKLINTYEGEKEFKKIKFAKGIIEIIFEDTPCTSEEISKKLLELEEELNNYN